MLHLQSPFLSLEKLQHLTWTGIYTVHYTDDFLRSACVHLHFSAICSLSIAHSLYTDIAQTTSHYSHSNRNTMEDNEGFVLSCVSVSCFFFIIIIITTKTNTVWQRLQVARQLRKTEDFRWGDDFSCFNTLWPVSGLQYFYFTFNFIFNWKLDRGATKRKPTGWSCSIVTICIFCQWKWKQFPSGNLAKFVISDCTV